MDNVRRFNLWGEDTTEELRAEIERQREEERKRQERQETLAKRKEERDRKLRQIEKDIDTLLYGKDLFGEEPTDDEREEARKRLYDYLK